MTEGGAALEPRCETLLLELVSVPLDKYADILDVRQLHRTRAHWALGPSPDPNPNPPGPSPNPDPDPNPNPIQVLQLPRWPDALARLTLGKQRQVAGTLVERVLSKGAKITEVAQADMLLTQVRPHPNPHS